ncbi:MAG TPA: hypothetical protein VG735_08010 [Caulobacterales bacterium]|nr:hypothetical protein [Caulobacterales bacterium]
MAENKADVQATTSAPPPAPQPAPRAAQTSNVTFRKGDEPVVEVEFLRSVQFENGGRAKGPTYREGKRYKFGKEHADRWIRRAVAYDTAGPAPEIDEPAAPVVGLSKGGASAPL